MTSGTVAAGMVRALVGLAKANGAAAEDLLASAGLPADALDEQDGRIALDAYRELMRAAKRLTGDAAFALHFGEAFDMADFSPIGAAAAPSMSIEEGLERLNRYGRLVLDLGCGAEPRFELSRTGKELWLVDRRPDPNLFPELTESTFARIASATRRTGSLGFVQEVHVTHPPPAHREEYDRIFGVPVTFGSAWNAMRVDPAFLDGRLPAPPSYTREIMTRHADLLLERLDDEQSMRGQLECTLRDLLAAGDVSTNAAAARLKMSRQTLYRRLRAEQTSFDDVLRKLRHGLAMQYIRDRRMPISEVAHRLGFSDRAAFAKAFKRWTGRSPGAVRSAVDEA